MVGCIIGPKGSQIRNIRSESGASVLIKDKEGERVDRDIVISGSKSSVSSALKLIHDLLEREGTKVESKQ